MFRNERQAFLLFENSAFLLLKHCLSLRSFRLKERELEKKAAGLAVMAAREGPTVMGNAAVLEATVAKAGRMLKKKVSGERRF